jgi:heme-degrading monooxygenase HmoA
MIVIMITKKPAKPEFVIVWEFRVRIGKTQKFERVYGPDGAWAKFFRSGKGYIRTELIRELKEGRRYLTIDVWTSAEAYSRFKKENRVEYQAIDEKCASLTQDERKIGEFRGITGQHRLRF